MASNPNLLTRIARSIGDTYTNLSQGRNYYGQPMFPPGTRASAVDIPGGPIGEVGALGVLPRAGLEAAEIPAARAAGLTAPAQESVQIPKSSLVSFENTRPVAKYVPDTSGGYSEAEMHARAMRNRAAESEPPTVNQFPVGTWGTDSTGELMQLREYPLNDPRLIFTEGTPKNQTVSKYADWINQGHEPPPLTGLETEKGNIKISEGHHRAAAIQQTGGDKAKVWVSITRNRPIGNGQVMPEGVKPEAVPPDVLEKYPDLKSLGPNAPAARRLSIKGRTQ